MPEKAPERCPQCNGSLLISELHCPECDLAITGEFGRCRFCELPPEQLAFLDVFIRCRGVIRQMEKELGISYPTVRSRIGDLLEGLRLGEEPDQPASIRAVLDELDRGEISADEALARIDAIRGRKR